MGLSPVQKVTAAEAVVQQSAVVTEKVAVQNPVTEVAQKALAEAPVAAEKSLCDRFCTWIKELFDKIFSCFKCAKKEKAKAEETPAGKASDVAAAVIQKKVEDELKANGEKAATEEPTAATPESTAATQESIAE